MAKQLDADLKNAPDEAGSTELLDRDADERDRVRRTGWEPERGVFFRLQRADQQCSLGYDYDSGRCEEAAFRYDTESSKENPPLRVGLDYGGDLVRGAVQLGRAVEQMMDDAPTRDGATTPPHIDSKRRKKLWQKKTALGHAEDDHEEWTMEQHL